MYDGMIIAEMCQGVEHGPWRATSSLGVEDGISTLRIP